MPDCDPQDLCNLLANDVLQLREKRAELPIMLLADGAPEMWNLLDDNFPTCVFGRVHSLIDFWHVIEKLEARRCCQGPRQGRRSEERDVWQWRQLLRDRRDAANMILAELHASGREEVMIDGERPVHNAITYLQNNAHRMNYAGAIRKEPAHRQRQRRGNLQDSRRCAHEALRIPLWHNDTGNHVLHLRALALSDRGDDAVTNLFATQRTSVRRRAA